jgi:hypothetical protein
MIINGTTALQVYALPGRGRTFLSKTPVAIEEPGGSGQRKRKRKPLDYNEDEDFLKLTALICMRIIREQ